MSHSPARHMGTDQRPSTTVRIALVLVISAAESALLEAGTVFGSFCNSVRDLSLWMPKRMLVFFALLLVSNTLGSHMIQRHRGAQKEAGGRTRAAKLCVANAVVIAAGAALGYAAGIPTARAMGDSGDIRYGISLAAVAISVLLLILNHKRVVKSLEWGFLIVALSFGSAFCLLMPTAAEVSWDGQIHFGHANALSYVFDAEYTGADVIMTMAGEQGALFQIGDLGDVEHFSVELDSREVSFPQADLEDASVNKGNDLLRRAEETAPPIRLLGTARYPGGSYVAFNSLGRIPNAIGLWIGRLLHLDCVGRYTLSRLFNMWFYVAVFFFAIRALKNGKAIMAVIGLCPTAMLEAANFSYDPWSISLLSLSVGIFVGKLQGSNKLTAHDSIQFLVPFILGAAVRAVVFPLGFLFFFVPRRRFVSNRAWAGHLLTVLLAVFLLLSSFAIPYYFSISSGASTGDARGGSDVNSGQQIAYVVQHPLQTFETSIVFGLKMLNPLNLGLALDPSDENLMYYFPYVVSSRAPLNEILAAAEFLLLTVMALFDGGEEDESFGSVAHKLAALVSFVLAFALISGALYVGFTAVGRDTIAGVQQRYLLGLLATFLLFVPNTKLRRKKTRKWVVPSLLACETMLLTLVTLNTFALSF